MNKITPVLLLLFILAACAPAASETSVAPLATPPANFPTMATSGASAPPEETSPAVLDGVCSVPETWSLSFHRSGGFAAFDQTLSINSQGELQVESNRPPLTSSRLLSADELARLAELLKQACPFAVPTRRGVCADCFNYELRLQWGEQAYVLQATDANLPEEWRALIGALSQFFQENAP